MRRSADLCWLSAGRSFAWWREGHGPTAAGAPRKASGRQPVRCRQSGITSAASSLLLSGSPVSSSPQAPCIEGDTNQKNLTVARSFFREYHSLRPCMRIYRATCHECYEETGRELGRIGTDSSIVSSLSWLSSPTSSSSSLPKDPDEPKKISCQRKCKGNCGSWNERWKGNGEHACD